MKRHTYLAILLVTCLISLCLTASGQGSEIHFRDQLFRNASIQTNAHGISIHHAGGIYTLHISQMDTDERERFGLELPPDTISEPQRSNAWLNRRFRERAATAPSYPGTPRRIEFQPERRVAALVEARLIHSRLVHQQVDNVVELERLRGPGMQQRNERAVVQRSEARQVTSATGTTFWIFDPDHKLAGDKTLREVVYPTTAAFRAQPVVVTDPALISLLQGEDFHWLMPQYAFLYGAWHGITAPFRLTTIREQSFFAAPMRTPFYWAGITTGGALLLSLLYLLIACSVKRKNK